MAWGTGSAWDTPTKGLEEQQLPSWGPLGAELEGVALAGGSASSSVMPPKLGAAGKGRARPAHTGPRGFAATALQGIHARAEAPLGPWAPRLAPWQEQAPASCSLSRR